MSVTHEFRDDESRRRNRMNKWMWAVGLAFAVLLVPELILATTKASKDVVSLAIQEENVKCINCHLKENNSLVQQWKNSPHAAAQDGQIGCYNCHAANQGDPVGYMHEGVFMKTVQSPAVRWRPTPMRSAVAGSATDPR
jgi:hypothetical protein